MTLEINAHLHTVGGLVCEQFKYKNAKKSMTTNAMNGNMNVPALRDDENYNAMQPHCNIDLQNV